MRERQRSRMQGLTVYACQHSLRKTPIHVMHAIECRFSASVIGITDHRMTSRRHVHADLMRTTGMELEPHI